MDFTVFGASGFIGSNLVRHLKALSKNVYCPGRDEIIAENTDLGNVIYCIGLTSDFRKKPFDTIEAHVSKLKHVLQNYSFSSFVYLSSTRIYIHNKDVVNEDSLIPVSVNDPFDLFNSSKLTGELLTLNCGKENVHVARISNVYGDDLASENFITSIIKDALKTGKIVLRTTPQSAKDYISIKDVIQLLFLISTNGKQKVYNVASGLSVKNKDILEVIKNVTNCNIEFSNSAEEIIFPEINVNRIKNEFDFKPSSTVIGDLESIIKMIKTNIN